MKDPADQSTFLDKISNALFTSFDDKLTLQKVAKLIVPELADYCRIAILDENNNIQEIAVNHTDPTKVQLATDLYDSYKNRPETTHGIPNLLKTGRSEIIEKIDRKILKTVKSKKLLKIVQQIELKSYMGIPLISREKIIGAVTFSSVKEGRFYTPLDLKFVEEVGRRIALAIDNDRLFQETKKAKLLAIKEKQRLSFGQRAGKIGTYEWSITDNKSTWTPEFETLYGYANGGYPASDIEEWLKLVHPEDRSRVIKTLEKALKKGDEVEQEFRVIWPDKSVHYIAHRAQIIRDEKGKAIRMNGVNIDITDRMVIDNNLKYLAEASRILSSSLDYKTTLTNVAKLTVPQIADWCGIDIKSENGIDQLAVAHVDSKKVKWAKKYRKMDPPDLSSNTGLAKVIKTGVSEFYPEITDDMLIFASKGNPEKLKLLRKLGMTSVMIVPLCVGKQTVGVITFISAENKRHYTKADLSVAEEVASRAALAIENSRLFTEAKNAVSTRDEFISVASHELKTPVTSLKIYTQVMQREFKAKDDQRIQKLLEKMDAQVNKLTVLIGDLLNVSKLQLGKLEFHEEKFDLHSVIDDIVETVQQSTDKHIITTNGKLKEKVWGDRDRIGQVVANLLTNAIKYSPKSDKVIITLTPEKKFAVVSVQDFGIGIDKEHLPRLFNRFYRVTGQEERTFPGLGLGLYISSQIIERHGGIMNVVSNKGKGSQFSFTIPYEKPPKSKPPTI